MKDHPLFPAKPEADVQTIHVLRFQQGRKCYAAQRFMAEELTEIGHVFERFGGGQYELEARGPTGKGSHGIVARQEYQIDGASRPLNPEPSGATAAQPAAVAPQAVGLQDPLIALLLQSSKEAAEDRRAMMTMFASLARPATPASDGGMTTVLAAMIQSQTEITKAMLLSRAPTTPEKDPVDRVLEIFQAGAELREGMAASVAERASKGELDLTKLAEGTEKVIGVIKQAKELADSGGSPAEVAAAASAAAE